MSSLVPKRLNKKRDSLYKAHSKDFMITDSLKYLNKVTKKKRHRHKESVLGVDLLFSSKINSMIEKEDSKKRDHMRVNQFER